MSYLIAVLAIVGGVVCINNCSPSLWESSITVMDYKVSIGVLVLVFIGYLAIRD